MLVNLTIPVHNEEAQLAESLRTVLAFLDQCNAPRPPPLSPSPTVPSCTFEVVIAENGSTDHTLELARNLAAQDPRVRVMTFPTPGRGQALKQAWQQSQADLLSYMDVDLSADLSCYPALLQPLWTGTHDLTVGSRLLPASHTTRRWRREILSRSYSRLARWCVHAPCRDLQCGFKALTREVACAMLPFVHDSGWFFDTELLVRANRSGYRIAELPIRWIEDPDSRVHLLRTVWEDLKGLARLYRDRPTTK